MGIDFVIYVRALVTSDFCVEFNFQKFYFSSKFLSKPCVDQYSRKEYYEIFKFREILANVKRVPCGSYGLNDGWFGYRIEFSKTSLLFVNF